MMKLTIGRIAREADTQVETVRYYERIGLLRPPARTDANYRVYGVDDLGRLSFIRRARELGFSIDQVRSLLTLADKTTEPCGPIEEVARSHRQMVESKISDLLALKLKLDTLIRECGQGSTFECSIIDALSPRPPSPATPSPPPPVPC
jgi:DNA-binding transcriptional MerR regulator